ncbi:hypothetical protein [Cupriavidus necator]|uniref:hypothetical protein n=1 Tax=Cupriavidus necator TaxID=106590 RepID=UPI00339D3263
MTTTASNAYQDKAAADHWPLHQRVRRLDREEIDKIARRRVRIELEAHAKKMADTKTLTPAMVGTGILAGIAFAFSVMTLLNDSTQDKVDKATGPVSARLIEIDKRVTDRFDVADKRMERLEGRVDKVEERLSRIESRLDRFDTRFDAVDARFDAVDRQFESIDTKLNLLLKRR